MGCQETFVPNVCLAWWWFSKKQKHQKLKSIVGSGVFVCNAYYASKKCAKRNWEIWNRVSCQQTICWAHWQRKVGSFVRSREAREAGFQER